MKSLSINFREAINAQSSDEVPIFLLTVESTVPVFEGRWSTDPTERVSVDPLLYKTVSRGEDFWYVPMSVVLPSEREDAPPRSQIRISHVTRELVELVRSTTRPARAKLELVLGSALDIVEVESPWMRIVTAGIDSQEVALEMSLNSLITEQVPCDSFDPAAFPGLHTRL